MTALMARAPYLSHERAVQVFGFLAEFAGTYPSLCEHDQRHYRDLARAAILVMREQEDIKELGFSPAIELVLSKLVRAGAAQDVGHYVLKTLRDRGLKLSYSDGKVLAGPRERITDNDADLIKRYKSELVEAIASEIPGDTAPTRKATT